jgi:hypothetical protein
MKSGLEHLLSCALEVFTYATENTDPTRGNSKMSNNGEGKCQWEEKEQPISNHIKSIVPVIPLGEERVRLED